MFTREEFSKKLFALGEEAGLSGLCRVGEERLFVIVERLERFSKQFNLTAITEPEEVMQKHIIDCLFAAKLAEELAEKEGSRHLDVGSGAGFPSLPIAAAVPSLFVTALDSTAKKTVYMNETALEAGISNFNAVSMRAEEGARSEMRESFDTVSARAVARLNVLMELCAPFLRVGGYFIAMKGAAADEERDEARSAAEKLGLCLDREIPYTLPGLTDARKLLVYKKTKKTPDAYPRNYSQISKKPL